MADKFAQIAGITSNRKELLTVPQPIPYTERLCHLEAAAGRSMATPKKMSSKAELTEALRKMKQQYEPFLQDLAPALESYTRRTEIREFMRDGKRVCIPDYGGPVGFAFTEYTADVTIDDFTDKAVYLCFGGADYKATVYWNGACVGIHEGFFSPFEFDVTRYAQIGKNTVRVSLQNDYVFMGSSLTADEAVITEGDKLYAATGLGYDDPVLGWHHCPPGMGLYGSVAVEIRNRIHITDVYVRPLPESGEAEAWIEVENADHTYKDVEFALSLYGQNFVYTGMENQRFIPWLAYAHPGDTVKTTLNQCTTDLPGLRLVAKYGKNVYKMRLKIDDARIWDVDTPWLYQLQVRVGVDGVVCDAAKQPFGMRSFHQDTESSPKGMFYLNGRKIRLRGANTMGFEQQDVLNGRMNQLVDDILYAKLCHMNFWRLTQRPVQKEVYEYCDRLGLLTQTDLPLFGVMRRSKVAEGIRQCEEMIRMVRKHPCNVVVSYINEPFPNSYENPHRHLEREELERFFTACDMVAEIHCPDCVIKHVDGDYDAPSPGSMPDNHCYTLWYNNHCIEFRRLHKGYWQHVADDWYYGCGEYGAEGLDFREVMEECYPKEWLREPFSPANIVKAQSGEMQHYFFDCPENMDGWIEETQAHQAFTARFMTEAFRRDNRMVSNAIHLFIDAWPSGWMKSIMDCHRNPKPAYFAYRNALEPIMVSLRSDRFTYFSGETAKIEVYVCNDTVEELENCLLHLELLDGGEPVLCGDASVACGGVTSAYGITAVFDVPAVADRSKFSLKAVLMDTAGRILADQALEFEAFADVEVKENGDVVLITDLEPGEHEVAGEKILVKACDHRNYISAQTGHPAVREFQKNDFRFWYDRDTDMLSVMTDKVLYADGFSPILTAWDGEQETPVLAEKKYCGKTYIVSVMNLRCENPVAKRLLKNLYEL